MIDAARLEAIRLIAFREALAVLGDSARAERVAQDVVVGAIRTGLSRIDDVEGHVARQARALATDDVGRACA